MNPVETSRFVLREITLEDVTDSYLSWLNHPATRRFIISAGQTHTLQDLRAYVQSRVGRSDVLFLGIFEKLSGRHIGNIKFEPIDDVEGYAVMGMLIGERNWQGRGVSSEVLDAALRAICELRGVGEFVLGVEVENAAAVRAYEKNGFRIQETDRIAVNPSSAVSMVRRIG